MSRYLSLEQFRQRIEVVPTDDLSAHGSSDLSAHGSSDLSAREPTSREPTKYYDPFTEREDV